MALNDVPVSSMRISGGFPAGCSVSTAVGATSAFPGGGFTVSARPSRCRAALHAIRQVSVVC